MITAPRRMESRTGGRTQTGGGVGSPLILITFEQRQRGRSSNVNKTVQDGLTAAAR